MKYSLQLVLAFAAVATAMKQFPPGMFNHIEHIRIPSTGSGNVTWGVFNAKLDHFNATSNETFAMRYNYNAQFARKKNPPILIYVGGEWTIDEGTLESGQIFATAKETEGVMFYTEHRYYGESIPTPDYKTESLKLLTSRQAMEDLIQFIRALKENKWYKDSKVVLFGCSYSASLVTWTKVKHPDLITSIYASSGPMEAKTDMHEYLYLATLVLQSAYSECATIIEEGIKQLEALYLKDDKGRAAAQKKLGICVPEKANEPLDRATIFEQISALFGSMVQSDLNRLTRECQRLVDAKGNSSMEKLGYFWRHGKDESHCQHGNYDNNKLWYQDTTLEGGGIRAFMYQKCNEFGWFVTTHDPNQIFGSGVLPFYFRQLCRDAFSSSFTDEYIENATKNTNKNYGGKTPDIRKAVFVYGVIDPWAPIGIDDSLNDEALVYRIQGAGHCWDMFAESPNDTEEMGKTKRDTRAMLKKWLEE